MSRTKSEKTFSLDEIKSSFDKLELKEQLELINYAKKIVKERENDIMAELEMIKSNGNSSK